MNAAPSRLLPSLALLTEDLRTLRKVIVAERSTAISVFGTLKRHQQLAASRHLRRAEEVGTRDNRVMWFGHAIELKHGLGDCDVAFAGAQFAGEIILSWQLTAALDLRQRDPDACIDYLDLLREILLDEDKRAYLTALGAFVRFKHLSDHYWAEHSAFETSKHGCDPARAWRRLPVTASQKYMISRIAPLLGSDALETISAITTRGLAHDFIKQAGGNPRFQRPPPLPRIEEGLTPQTASVEPPDQLSLEL